MDVCILLHKTVLAVCVSYNYTTDAQIDVCKEKNIFAGYLLHYISFDEVYSFILSVSFITFYETNMCHNTMVKYFFRLHSVSRTS